MKLIDIVLIAVIIAAVAFAVWLTVRRKRRGCCDGHCDKCSGCH